MDSDHSVFTVPVTPQYVASVLHAEKHKVGFHTPLTFTQQLTNSHPSHRPSLLSMTRRHEW